MQNSKFRNSKYITARSFYFLYEADLQMIA